MNRSRLAALSAGAMFLVASVIAPAVATADTGNTNTIKVLPATTTISPVGTGSSITVAVAANTAGNQGGASAGLGFDKTKLSLTAIAKGAQVVADGAGFGGFPSSANTATFISTANSTGQIPNIGYFFTDGATFEPANTNITIYTATFSVTAVGDNTLIPNDGPALLSGEAATYGNALTIDSILNGTVVNHVAPSFSISAAPGSITVNQGSSNTTTVSATATAGSPGPITLSIPASGPGSLPTGVTASFATNPISAGSTTSVLTISAGASAVSGTFSVTVIGTDGTSSPTTSSTSVSVSVQVPDDFSLSASPSSVSFLAGAGGTTTINSTVLTGSPGTIALSVTGAPAGVTTSFSNANPAAGSPSTLTINSTAATVPGTYPLTVSGTSSNTTNPHTRFTTVNLTVGAPPPPGDQGVGFTGTVAGGFIALTCPTSVSIPLVRGNTNRVTTPCFVNSNSVWNLNVNDTAPAGPNKGHMVTSTTPVYALANTMHVLSGQFTDPAGNPAFTTDVNLATGGSALTGTNATNAQLTLSQFVAAGDRPGNYSIQLLFSAVSVF